MMKKILTILTLFLIPLISFSHPGHGAFNDSLLHYFTAPEHLTLAALAGIVGLLLIFRKKIWKSQ